MGRSPCCGESGDLKKGPWTPEEDHILSDYVQKHGHGSWRALPKRAGLNRCGKSCRLRWINYLRPDIKRGKFSEDEENLIIKLHSALGNKWARIATQLPGRTDNEIKNFWNTHLRKKLLKTGIDPKTHKPIPNLDFLVNSISQLITLPLNFPCNISTIMSPWINNTALGFPSNPTQLNSINNQLLYNALQILNTKPLPNFVNSSFSARHFDFNQSAGLLISEMINQHAMDSSQEWVKSVNKDTLEPDSKYNAVGSCSMGSYGDGSGALEALNAANLKSSISDNFLNENQLPGLVSTSLGESTDNQMDIKSSTDLNHVVEVDWDSEDYSFLWKDTEIE